MKKHTLLPALLAAALLCGCGGGLVTLKYEDGLFVNKNKNCSYVPAEITYEPTQMGEAYAYYKKGDLTLYAIGDHDPALWLTEAYAGGATTVFHDESITLPTLAEFGTEKILVCDTDIKTVVVYEITDAAMIAETVRLFTEGETCEWPLIDSTLRFELKFASAAWPQIHINLIYGEFPEGNFLYERASGRCVRIDGHFDALFHPDEVKS